MVRGGHNRMRYKRSPLEITFDIINIILMFILLIATLYPFLHVVFSSLSSSEYVIRNKGLILWPKGFNLKGYKYAFKHPMLGKAYLNTILYAGAGTLIGLITMSLSAYAFAKPSFPGKGFFLFIIVFTMFFSGGLIPSYLNVRRLGLLNTRFIMIILGSISTWSIIMLRTNFQEIPASLAESAYLDGANDFTILFRIVLPLSKAILAVITLFSVVGYWNSWFSALIYLDDRSKYPLQMILREILITGEMADLEVEISDEIASHERAAISEIIKYATMVLTIGPIILIYPFLQKYFIEGVMIGSIKG